MKTNTIRIFTLATLAAIVLLVKCTCNNSENSKTPGEIQKEKQDSIATARDTKIDLALTQLKDQVKKQLKNPDSFKLLDRTYDKKDTADVVKLVIKYTATNSFNASVTSVTFGTYNFKTDSVLITETRQE